jgi:hypothetical protein
MNQVGTKLAATCGQELPRCCQDGQLGHFVVSFGTISNQFCFFCVFFCGWVGIAKSMKTTNSPSLLLDFRRSGCDFSAVFGKFGKDLRSLELFWFQGLFFCRFSAMLGKAWQQDGAK